MLILLVAIISITAVALCGIGMLCACVISGRESRREEIVQNLYATEATDTTEVQSKE